MSYYRRRSYRNYSRTSNVPAQTVRKPKKNFDIVSYIKNEFFNADDIILTRITDLYYDLYGYGAHKYLIDTYYSWKSGRVGLSGQTMQRILECVPKFLSDEKRFYILKCEIIYFIEALHFKQKNKNVSLSQLNDVFENYGKEIDTFNEVNLSWFVGKGIFTETEIQQFLSVCKYALNRKLILSYRQVQNDLFLIKEKLSTFKKGSFKADYQIDFLDSKINISDINETDLKIIEFKIHAIKLEGIFRKYAEQYIIEELMKMNFTEQEGEINHYIKSQDLDFFISQYNEILGNDNEATLKSEFKGDGGKLNLVLDIKSLKRIQFSILFSVAKLVLFVAILVTAIILIFALTLYKFAAIIFWVVFVGGIFLISSILQELKTIKNSKTDLKIYGKQQR